MLKSGYVPRGGIELPPKADIEYYILTVGLRHEADTRFIQYDLIPPLDFVR
jgi:hypothetical protein